MPPLIETLRSVDPTFKPVPHMADGHRTRALRNREGFRVELLVPNRGSDDYEGRPVSLRALGETDGPAIRFLDQLIYEEVDAVVLHKAGVLVKVPQPARFAIHKLIIAARRAAGNPKSRKDAMQAELLIEALTQTRRGDELQQAWADAADRGPKWQELLQSGASRLSGVSRQLFQEKVGRLK